MAWPELFGRRRDGSALTGWKEGLTRDTDLLSGDAAPFFTDTRWYSDLIDHSGGGNEYVKFRARTVVDLNPSGGGDVSGPTLGHMIDAFNAANDIGMFDFRAQLTDKGQFQLVATSDEARLRLPNGGIQHHFLGLGYGAGDLVPAATRTADVVPAYDRFRAVVEQLEDVSRGSGFNGRNLLDYDTMSVALNETGSTLDLTGFGSISTR